MVFECPIEGQRPFAGHQRPCDIALRPRQILVDYETIQPLTACAQSEPSVRFDQSNGGVQLGSTSNLQVIRDLYASFATGDAAAMSRPFNDESVWVESGNNTRSGVFRGAQAIGEHTMSCMQQTDGTWATDVREIVGGETYVVVVERALGQRNGKSLATMCCTMYEMADGLVVEMRVLPFDAKVWDDFWS